MASPPAEHREVPLVPVPSRVLATWPVGHFLENIAVLGDGSFVVAVHNQKALHRVAIDGTHSGWCTLPVSPAGMVATKDALYVVGGEPGHGPHHLFEVGLNGEVADRGAIPNTLFLNGFTPGRVGRGYAVDSLVGMIVEITLETGASEVVLQDERLMKISAEPMLPGANGIKAGRDALFISNTDRALILRAGLRSDGSLDGTLTTIAEQLRGDDLAVDEAGDLYVTNHIHNTLIRLRQNGERVAIAGPDQGMAGSTACVFGTTPETRQSLFVTTTGGIVMPLNGVVQQAKLVRLELEVAGRPLTFL